MSEISTRKRGRPRPGASTQDTLAGSPPTRTGRLADLGLVAAFLVLTFLLGVFPLKDTDFWWHLRTGDWIRAHKQVPVHDLYTFTVPDNPWTDLHWGFEVLLSWGYGLVGVVGLNLAKCAITCVAVLLLLTARRRDWPVSAMLLAWLPALFVLGGRMYIRPETLSLLYLSVFLAVLFRWQRFPALAFLLPVVEVLWVNTQGLFVLGLIVLAFGLIDAALSPGSFSTSRRGWWRTVGLASALTGLACLVNPYGLMGALFPIQLAETMRNPIFSESIGELTPIGQFIKQAGWFNLPLQMHLATILLGALSFLVPIIWRVAVRSGSSPVETAAEKTSARPGKASKSKGARRSTKKTAAATTGEGLWRLSPFRLLLFAAFSVLSWQATRNSHQFAAVVGTVTAWNFGEWAAAIRHRAGARAGPQASDLLPRLLALAGIMVALVAVASGWFYRAAGEGRTIGLGEEPLWFPHKAVKFAGQPGMPPRFLSFHIGHAGLFEFQHGPERKVFADARLEVIGPELYQRYLDLQARISRDETGWARELDDLESPVVLTDHAGTPEVGAGLMGNGHWRCVWFDPIAAVFVHDSFKDIAQMYAVDFAARHFRPDPATTPRGVPELLATAKALTRYVGGLQQQGRLALGRPLVLLGLDYARRIIAATPSVPDGWKSLGQLELAREPSGKREPVPRFRMAFDPVIDLSMLRATYAFQQSLERAPDDFLSLLALALTYRMRAMDEAELPLLERLLDRWSVDPKQADEQENARQQCAAIRARLGAAPTSQVPPNRSEHDRLVHALLAAGRAESAAEILERDYPVESRNWEVADRIATIRLHLGQPARARAVWQQAIAPPKPATRLARVAVTFLIEGDFDAARRSFREALAIDPTLFEALFGLAILEQDAGRATEALAAARQALEHAPGDVARTAAQTLITTAAPYAEAAADTR